MWGVIFSNGMSIRTIKENLIVFLQGEATGGQPHSVDLPATATVGGLIQKARTLTRRSTNDPMPLIMKGSEDNINLDEMPPATLLSDIGLSNEMMLDMPLTKDERLERDVHRVLGELARDERARGEVMSAIQEHAHNQRRQSQTPDKFTHEERVDFILRGGGPIVRCLAQLSAPDSIVPASPGKEAMGMLANALNKMDNNSVAHQEALNALKSAAVKRFKQ